MTDGPYARVYLAVVDDERFRDVYDDDHHLATWLRLLLTAEGCWPASASLPLGVRAASVKLLADVGLLELQPRHRYRIHGLDNERERRSNAGRTGGLASGIARRTFVERSLNGARNGIEPSRDEHRQDETSVAREDGEDEGMTEAMQWLARHEVPYLSPGSKLYVHLAHLLTDYGVNRIVGLWDRFAEQGVKGDAGLFVFGAKDALIPKPDIRQLEAEDREEESAAQRQRRVEANEKQLAEYRKMVAK